MNYNPQQLQKHIANRKCWCKGCRINHTALINVKAKNNTLGRPTDCVCVCLIMHVCSLVKSDTHIVIADSRVTANQRYGGFRMMVLSHANSPQCLSYTLDQAQETTHKRPSTTWNPTSFITTWISLFLPPCFALWDCFAAFFLSCNTPWCYINTPPPLPPV